MSGNGSEDSSLSHYIAQSSQMSIINVNTIRSENHTQLTDQAEADGFNSQNLQDLIDRVTSGAGSINTGNRQDLGQSTSISFDDPVLLILDELSSAYSP